MGAGQSGPKGVLGWEWVRWAEEKTVRGRWRIGGWFERFRWIVWAWFLCWRWGAGVGLA